MSYPNLLQSFRVDPKKCQLHEIRMIVSKIMEWSRVADVIGFDEWINNVDRNLQNVLWDGYDEFVLIDHGLTLGTAPPEFLDQNKLADLTVATLMPNRAAIDLLKERVLEAALGFHPSYAHEASESLDGAPLDEASANTAAFLTFVKERLPTLAALVAKRFPSQQLGLEGI